MCIHFVFGLVFFSFWASRAYDFILEWKIKNCSRDGVVSCKRIENYPKPNWTKTSRIFFSLSLFPNTKTYFLPLVKDQQIRKETKICAQTEISLKINEFEGNLTISYKWIFFCDCFCFLLLLFICSLMHCFHACVSPADIFNVCSFREHILNRKITPIC